MRSPGQTLAAMCVIETLGMAAFATFPTLIPTFKSAWQISNTQAGWISGVYFAGYIVAVAVLTALTDRVSAKRIYLASMALSGAAALGFAATASGVWSASLWHLLQGVGLAGTYMPGLKALTDQLPERLHARATAFYTSSFGVGSSLSYFLSGVFADAFGWPATFALCALGPVIAFVLACMVLETHRPAVRRAWGRVLDLRPALRNRAALGFTLAYTAHNVELFAFRAWIVSFLVFCQTQQAPGAAGVAWSAATIAALINLVGLPSSVLGNEIAGRLGRQRTAIAIMSASALVGMTFGFSGIAPFGLVVALGFLYGVTITGESATLTAGLVKSAAPEHRGVTMATYSVIGFLGAFGGPLLFGLVLDAAGGADRHHAWGAAFACMALVLLLGPFAVIKLVGLKRVLY